MIVPRSQYETYARVASASVMTEWPRKILPCTGRMPRSRQAPQPPTSRGGGGDVEEREALRVAGLAGLEARGRDDSGKGGSVDPRDDRLLGGGARELRVRGGCGERPNV